MRSPGRAVRSRGARTAIVAAAVEGRGEDRLGAEELDRLHDGARAPIRRGERDVLGAKAEEDGALRRSGRRSVKRERAAAGERCGAAVHPLDPRRQEVHRRIAEEARHEGIGRLAVDLERRRRPAPPGRRS